MRQSPVSAPRPHTGERRTLNVSLPEDVQAFHTNTGGWALGHVSNGGARVALVGESKLAGRKRAIAAMLSSRSVLVAISRQRQRVQR